MHAFLAPRSVALVGVSSRPNTLSAVLLNNLKCGGYGGSVYLVNPKAEAIGGVPCRGQVSDLPRDIELALIMVPAREAELAVRQCGQHGIRAAVVITAGFRETSEEGSRREASLVHAASECGVRLIGPNSMGLMNLDDSVRFNATFSPAPATPGKVAFLTQSGALGVAILSLAAQWRVGFSQFVSIGNESDVTIAQAAGYCLAQESTAALAVYLESFAHAEQLLRFGKQEAGRKPLILLLAGRTEAGAAAAASHTGAMAARPGVAGQLFERAGFFVARSLEEMLEMAQAFSLSSAPERQGRSIAVLTNAGGPAVLATDTAVSRGLRLATLDQATSDSLRQLVLDAASVRNPVDLLPAATNDTYVACAGRLLADPAVGQLIAIKVNPPLGSPGSCGLPSRLGELRDHYGKPVIVSLMMPAENADWAGAGAIPCYAFPEAAARAAAALARFAEWRAACPPIDRPREDRPEWLPSHHEARELFLNALTPDAKIPIDELFELLEAYGISSPPCTITTDCRQAAAFASRCGYPVAVKTADPDIVHKTEAGGVWLDIRDASELCQAFQTIPASCEHGVLVQRYVKGQHREVLAGFLRDPRLGPLLAFGLGGTAVEALGDTAYLQLPAGEREIREMVASVRAAALLGAFRSRPPVDMDALVDVLRGLAQLGLDHPEILTVEINPLLAGTASETTVAVDVRLSVIGARC